MIIIKLWIDDVRPAPEGYYWCQSVDSAESVIMFVDEDGYPDGPIEVIDMDHDAGDFAAFGGDYIELLNWLEAAGLSYPIHIHSMNPVGVANIRAIIQRNGWKEI